MTLSVKVGRHMTLSVKVRRHMTLSVNCLNIILSAIDQQKAH